MKLSIIVPCYNEVRTIGQVTKELKELDLGKVKKEIIIIDDGSTDGSQKIIKDTCRNSLCRTFFQDKNLGKGSVLKKGFEMATGDIITIQDSDLELHPKEYKKLIVPILSGKSKIVYGSRYLIRKRYPGRPMRDIGIWVFAIMFNILFGTHLSDTETCYKMFRAELIKDFNPKSNGFGIDVELSAWFAKKHIEITEIPIDYRPRISTEGKKNNWIDGLKHPWKIIYFRFSD